MPKKKWYPRCNEAVEPVERKCPKCGILFAGTQFQMDCHGNFRIVMGDKESTPTGYEGIVCLEVDGETYIAVSHYYAIPKPETVFKLVPVETELAHTPMCNLFWPEEPCTHKELKGEK